MASSPLVTLVIPQEYSYVLSVLVLSGVINVYHGLLTGSARKAAAVPYPNAYVAHAEAQADIKKYKFNCAQRAHQNYLENLPTMLVASAIGGLKYPVVTAALGLVWCVGRVVYTRGYIGSAIEEKGRGRLNGAFYLAAQVGLLGTAGYAVYGMIMG